MRARPVLLAALLACAATGTGLAGCGGDDPAEQEQQVRQVLADYDEALVAGRNDEICSRLFTPELVQSFEATGGCEATLGEAPEAGDFELTVDDVTVEGMRATARISVSAPGPARGGSEGPQEAQGTIQLVEEDGSWRISEIEPSA